MAAEAGSRFGGGAYLATVGAVAVLAWAAGFYFRMAPPGAPGIRAVAPSIPAVTAEPPSSAAPSTPPSATATATTASAPVAVADAGELADAALGADGRVEGGDAGADAAATDAGEAPRALPKTDAESTACVKSLLPEDTFGSYQPSFAFVCVDPYARHAVTQLQSEITKGKWGTGTASAGMQEWAALGWYELAVLSLMRGRCCDSPIELTWTFKLICPIDEAMSGIEAGIREGDRGKTNQGIKAYTLAATCLARLGQGRNFGQQGMPGAGLTALQRFIERAKQTGEP